MLPRRLPKKVKRATRWRSRPHCDFVRDHACCNCGETVGIEAAHVRMNSGAGAGEKPDDWRVVSLCFSCHRGGGKTAQHTIGEPRFWANYARRKGADVEALIAAFIKASPKRAEIERVQKERENG
jgi:5-methylcytosine-specific restriction endonuclease McrA